MTGSISTHVLDLSTGKPASGVAVTLSRADGANSWTELAQTTTDADGRVRHLLPSDQPLSAGTYRLRFATASYFATQGVRSFHPSVTIDFLIDDPASPHHVPLLLSPFGYSTYRGS